MHIVALGASTGGLEALEDVLSKLPADLDAAVFVVLHMSADYPSLLPDLLERSISLAVGFAEDGARFEKGKVYVAPPDQHLIIDRDQIFLSRGPRENRVRPAVDPLFRSAALSHGPRTIGVVLSGCLDDGTSGLLAIQRAGGATVVQDPEDAIAPGMPTSALEYVDVDHCLPSSDIGPLLARLVASGSAREGARDVVMTSSERDDLMREVDILRRESGAIPTSTALGELVAASCPECGGPLWQMDHDHARFRCHTGHAFTARHLVAGYQEAEEQSLWVALRVMEERARMLRRLAKGDREKEKDSPESFANKAAETEQHVERLRNLLSSRPR